MSRKTARETAFQLIFSVEGQKGNAEEILELYMENAAISEKDSLYICDVVRGVFENIGKIDDVISNNSKNWKISRISRVALAILRLAIYEMQKKDDIPISVSVNEALELDDKFEGGELKTFINGILGSVDKELLKGDLF